MPFIRERLRESRKASKKTTQDVSDIVGVGRAVITKYENGLISKIDADKIELLAQAVHCDPAYLMGWQDSPTCEEMPVNIDERDLIEKFRMLNADGKAKAVEHIEVMIASQKFNK